jgi:hypothetical protein
VLSWCSLTHQKRISDVALNRKLDHSSRCSPCNPPVADRYSPVTAAVIGKKVARPHCLKNSFECNAADQLGGLITLGEQSWHRNMRWFSSRVKVPSERDLCSPQRKQLMVDMLAES